MPSVYAARASRRSGIPLVLSPRGCLSPEALRRSRWRKRAFWDLFYRSAFAACRCIHATSEREYEDVRDLGLTNPVAVIPNGVDLPPPSTRATRPTRTRSILFLGRVHPIKGLDVLIPAWKEAISSGVKAWTLRIVGPGDARYVEQLRSMAGALGLGDAIEFAPAAFGDAKWREYEAAAVTILPSRTENFGMTVAESLAAGTPVIASKGTPWEGLERERCGWWVELTQASIAGALLEATRTPEAQLEELGSRGRAWMERSFSWPAIASEMAGVYVWTAGNGPAPPSVRMA
jgi:glycosyltransferase involved in cell wall biosynthesis